MSTENQSSKIIVPSGSVWATANEKALMEPYMYLASTPGKGIRTYLINAINFWLHVPPKQLEIIAGIVDMLHLSSLMIDDIEDSSELRRGNPAAHRVYGIPQTINSAEYVFVKAIGEVSKLRPVRDDIDLSLIVNEELQSLHRGQGIEILWRDSLQCPSEEEYIDMANKKTSGLLRIAVRLMMGCATSNVGIDYVPLVNLLGVFFQIRDDLVNLDNSEYTASKGFAEDLSEGKFSFPLVHGIKANPENRLIISVLQKRPSAPTLKTHVINYLRDETMSFQYSRLVLSALMGQMHEEINRLGGNERLVAVLDRLSI